MPTATNPPCPFLPSERIIHGPDLTRRHGSCRDRLFYLDCLRYAQSQWSIGKPAQALLQLDRAMMADESNPECLLPYQAVAWILHHGSQSQAGFLGNPVRHFQHLASRMNHVNREPRIWRAWACFHLAERILPSFRFPRDGRQVIREGIWIPSASRSVCGLKQFGWDGESDQVFELLDSIH